MVKSVDTFGRESHCLSQIVGQGVVGAFPRLGWHLQFVERQAIDPGRPIPERVVAPFSHVSQYAGYGRRGLQVLTKDAPDALTYCSWRLADVHHISPAEHRLASLFPVLVERQYLRGLHQAPPS